MTETVASGGDGSRIRRFASSAVRKRQLPRGGRRSSLTLEDPFWECLCGIAEREGVTVRQLVERIDTPRAVNLSSAIRVFVLRNLRRRQRLGEST